MSGADPHHNLIEYNISSEHLRPSARHAYIHVPSTYDKQKETPLIVALHGKEQPPTEFANHTRFPAFGFSGLVVFPEGIKLQWTGDPESPPRSEVDDISFVNFLITKLQSEYSIDATRIYVAGFSNGGGLTDLLACDPTASGRVAAFAISSGAFYTDGALKEPLFSQCHPSRSPVPILEFHGSKDPVIHYDGKTTPDGETYNVLKWVKGWAKRNGCTVEDSKPTPEFDGKVERYSWSRDGKEVVVHYHIDGFGHGWPSTYPLNNDEQRHGPTYFNGTPVVLDFFRKFSLGKGSESQTVGNR